MDILSPVNAGAQATLELPASVQDEPTAPEAAPVRLKVRSADMAWVVHELTASTVNHRPLQSAYMPLVHQAGPPAMQTMPAPGKLSSPASATRPVPPATPAALTVSRTTIGNSYDGRYNRSRLLKPACASASSFEYVAHADAWFPVLPQGALSHTACSRWGRAGGDQSRAVGEMAGEGWVSNAEAAQRYKHMDA
jgi:hypothetical protein